MSAGTMYPLALSDLIGYTPSSNPNDRYWLTDTGKEGVFYLQATYPVGGGSPPAADNAITINSNPIGGNVYRYRRVNESGLIDVRWFGALGDGTDQTTALQAAFATTEGDTLVFGAPEVAYTPNLFVINGVTVSLNGKVLKFLPGNQLDGTATITDFIIDAGYQQQIFATHPTSDTPILITVSPAGCMDDKVSVAWFGAIPGTPNLQLYIQWAIDVVVANTIAPGAYALPKTVYFPRGTYVIDAPIIVASFDSVAKQYKQVTVLLKGEDPGVNRVSSLGATIQAGFIDTFAIGFQLAKGGGIESLSIVGNYGVPTMATDAFFNNNPFSTYLSTNSSRDEQFSPYSGVVIDPFRYDSLPTDGGYPGLSNWYTKATGQGGYPGSTGLYFKDLYVSKFTVCFAQSPNGQSQNGEVMIYEDIQVANCKLGFSSSQAQEKNNCFRNIMCWTQTHTLFSNQDYGAKAGAGNIIVEGVNIAGGLNRVLNWQAGGYFPSYFKNMYAERLGAVGNLLSGGIACTIEDSIFDFAPIFDFGDYYPPFHVNVSKEVTLRSCIFRVYDGQGFPVLLSGSGVYNECSFETPPITRIEEDFSSSDTIQFYNCLLTYTPAKIGSHEYLRGAINQFTRYALLGDWSVTDATTEIYNVYKQYLVSFYKLREFVNTSINATITISGATNSYSFTTPYYALFVVGEPVCLIQGALYEFAGLVTAVNAGTSTVTVAYAPVSVTSGTYTIALYPFLKPFRIFGDLTQGSYSATNVVVTEFAGAVGDFVFLPEFGGWNRITAISGSTYTFSGYALITRTGVTLTPPAIKLQMNSFNPYAPASTQVNPYLPFKKGDILLDSYGGIFRQYICIADGMFAPSDGRVAYFTLNGNIENSLTTTGSIIIPAGFMVEGFILNATANQSGLTIGTTSGGSDIASGLSLTAGVSKIVSWDYFTDAATTIYFGGISGATVSIKTIVKGV